MPRIPIYDQQAKLTIQGPMVEQDIRSYGMEQLAAAEIWGQVGAMGQRLSEVGLKLHRSLHQAQQGNDYSAMNLEARERLVELKQEVQKNADPGVWGASFKSGAEKIYGEILGKSRDAEVQAHFKNAWANHFPVAYAGVINKADQRRIQNLSGDFQNHTKRYIDLAVEAAGPADLSRLEADYFGYIAGAQAAGLILPKVAEAARQEFPRQVMMGKVLREAATDAAGVQRKLDRYKENYPGMDEAMFFELRPRIQAEMHRQQEAGARDVERLYHGGQLRPDALRGRYEAGNINLRTFRMYDAAMQADAAPVKAQKDADFYWGCFEAAQKGQLATDRVIQGQKTGKITLPQAHFLLRTQGAASQGAGDNPEAGGLSFIKDPYYKLAVAEIDVQLKKDSIKDKWMGTGYQGASALNEAKVKLLQACVEAQKQGKLTGPFMYEQALEIIKPYKLMQLRGRPGTPPPSPESTLSPAQREKAVAAFMRKLEEENR